MIEVALLGSITIRVNGEPPPAEALWRKHLAVTLLLWTERDRPVTRDRVLGLLWPEGSELAGRHSLNEALRVLRKAYGVESISSTAEAIQWVAELSLDLDEFVRLADADDLRAAALVRGAWCEGFGVSGAGEFEEWLSLERDRWRGRQTATLTRASGTHADRGELPAALQRAEQAAELNPWSDEAACAVMRARALVGDRAGAIVAGETHTARLATDLEARPAAATRSLLSQLREGGLSKADAEHRQTIGANAPPLLRRERTLESGLSVWRDATARREGATLCWIGAPGSGRSRLLQEIATRLRLEGARVAMIRAVPGDRHTCEAALAAIADAIVDSLPGLSGADPDAVAALVRLRPRWAERFPAKTSEREVEFHDALATVLVAASEEAAVVLAIDDVDRFHPDAIAALATLARAVQRHRVSLAVTTVDSSDDPSVGEFLRLPGESIPGMVIAVPPLDADHATALVRWAYPVWPEDAVGRLARRLVAESGESLFVAVELLLAIRNGLALPDAPVMWPAADRTLDATLPAEMPTTLVIALRHHWHQLDADEQSLLQFLSVGSEPRSDTALEEFVPDPGVRLDVLDQLELTRWLTSDSRGYSFASRIMRRIVAEDTMTPGQRRRVEGRVGS